MQASPSLGRVSHRLKTCAGSPVQVAHPISWCGILLVLAGASAGACASSPGTRPAPGPASTPSNAASSNTTPSDATPVSPWLSPLSQQHPLVGRILDPVTGEFVEVGHLVERCRKAGVVILGEKHDNADHHRLQAQLLGALVAGGARPAVAWEMVDVDQQATMDAYLAKDAPDAQVLGHVLQWEERGWPSWHLYQPLASLMLHARLPSLAANLPTGVGRAIARGSTTSLPSPLWQRLGLDQPLARPMQDALEQEMANSHCGALPKEHLAPMALAQRARDAHMALRASEPSLQVVLIAGNGHARLDHGVPWHLARMKPGVVVASVAFLEVEDGVEDPKAYLGLPYSAVWFTPRANDEDHCEGFRKQRAGGGATASR